MRKIHSLLEEIQVHVDNGLINLDKRGLNMDLEIAYWFTYLLYILILHHYKNFAIGKLLENDLFFILNHDGKNEVDLPVRKDESNNEDSFQSNHFALLFAMLLLPMRDFEGESIVIAHVAKLYHEGFLPHILYHLERDQYQCSTCKSMLYLE
jgi:hypothetical protein